MFGFFKWIFDSKAPVRPGCFSQVTLLMSAFFAMPGLLAIMTGRMFSGLWMLFASCIPIILFALPAWNAYRRSAAIEQTADRQVEIERQLEPEVIVPVVEDDEYSPLRGKLRDSNQDKAVRQLTLLIDKQSDFQSVLNHKFEESEVTYHRYRDSGEKVFNGALRNLESIAAFARSIRSLDQRALIEQLDTMIANGQGDSRSAAALRERLEMMTEGQQHINALLETNEEALTALTRVSTKLAGISTGAAQSGDLDRMIDDLHELAERSARYSTRIDKDKPTITIGQ